MVSGGSASELSGAIQGSSRDRPPTRPRSGALRREVFELLGIVGMKSHRWETSRQNPSLAKHTHKQLAHVNLHLQVRVYIHLPIYIYICMTKNEDTHIYIYTVCICACLHTYLDQMTTKYATISRQQPHKHSKACSRNNITCPYYNFPCAKPQAGLRGTCAMQTLKFSTNPHTKCKEEGFRTALTCIWRCDKIGKQVG